MITVFGTSDNLKSFKGGQEGHFDRFCASTSTIVVVEVVDLQSLAESTGGGGHVEALAAKKPALSGLLGVKAQGRLLRSRSMDALHTDAPSPYFFSLERRNGQRKIFHSLRTDTGEAV